MIEIYGVRIEQLPSKQTMFLALNKEYQEAWQKRHRSLRKEHNSRASLAGLLLLQWAGYRGALRYDENGRPYLDGSRIDFNITHTEQYAFCAIALPDSETPAAPPASPAPTAAAEGDAESSPLADAVRVGIDAENLDRIFGIRVCPLANRWFSQAEKEYFLLSPSGEQFLNIWTRKESLVKWKGTGLRDLRAMDTTTAEEQYGIRFSQYRVQNTIVTLCAGAALACPEAVSLLSKADVEQLLAGG